jgi:hypothetical protein
MLRTAKLLVKNGLNQSAEKLKPSFSTNQITLTKHTPSPSSTCQLQPAINASQDLKNGTLLVL